MLNPTLLVEENPEVLREEVEGILEKPDELEERFRQPAMAAIDVLTEVLTGCEPGGPASVEFLTSPPRSASDLRFGDDSCTEKLWY